MPFNLSNDFIDQFVVALANLINMFVIGVFLSRARRKAALEHLLGLVMVSLAIPIAAVVLHNMLDGREWWTVVLPGIMVVYLCVEFVLDYALKIGFRQTIFLWPYLVLFYAALIGLIGFSFLTSRWLGYVTLLTYFFGLAAMWYSYSKVGHGISERYTNGQDHPT